MKIMAVSQIQQTLDELRRYLAVEKNPFELSCFIGGISQVGMAVEQNPPNLLIFDTARGGQTQLAELELVTLRHPGMEVILLTHSNSPEFLTEAMRVGVREALPLNLSSSALLDAVFRAQKRTTLIHATTHKGKVLTFIACKGGSGATFLAVNLGYILAATHGKRVALLDLNLHFGSASLFVSDHMPASTIADVASNIQRLDASFLASSMVHVLPNFSVLAAPESPEHASEVKPEHLDALIELATAHYDFVILDMGRTLDAVSVRALDRADVIFPVLQETLPFIRDAKRLLATFQSLGYGREKIHLVVNRYEKGGDIRLEDVESTLGMKVVHTLPNSFRAVSASVNQGVPVLKIAPNDSLTKALLQWAKTLDEVSSVKQGGWLARMFSKA